MAGISDIATTFQNLVRTLGNIAQTLANLSSAPAAPPTTVALLPAAASNAGKLYVVSDATAPTYGATLVGGGAVYALALSDGSNWKAH